MSIRQTISDVSAKIETENVDQPRTSPAKRNSETIKVLMYLFPLGVLGNHNNVLTICAGWIAAFDNGAKAEPGAENPHGNDKYKGCFHKWNEGVKAAADAKGGGYPVHTRFVLGQGKAGEVQDRILNGTAGGQKCPADYKGMPLIELYARLTSANAGNLDAFTAEPEPEYVGESDQEPAQTADDYAAF